MSQAMSQGAVLVIEDDEAIAALLAEVLTAEGYHVTRVAGPETGDNTWVDLSPLNATLPVASITGRNETNCAGTR